LKKCSIAKKYNMSIEQRISIVTPSYNQGAFLEETILSVLNQNHPNIEYIIIDGGSTDNSVEIIKKYEKHLAYWVSEPDNGMYHAIQKGFDKCTGEIMAWINSDDIFSTGAFSIVEQVFAEYSEVEWITGKTANIDEKSRITTTLPVRVWNKYDYLFGNYKYIQQEGTFWRKSLWEKAGSTLNFDYSLAGDMELWARFFTFTDLYSINAITGFFRVRSSNQKTKESLNEYISQAEQIIKGYLPKSEKEQMIALKKKTQMPFLWRFHTKKFNQINKYPPKIDFDRETQKFFVS